MPYAVILPELALAVGAMLLLLLGAFRGDEQGSSLSLRLAVALLAGAGVWTLLGTGRGGATFGGVLVLDGFAAYAKALAFFGAAVALLISRDYLRRNGILKAEYPVLFVFAALGMAIMVSASDLMSLYMGLELQSLCLYVLAAFRRDAGRSTEAGLKYFVLGALSSGLLLYGREPDLRLRRGDRIRRNRRVREPERRVHRIGVRTRVPRRGESHSRSRPCPSTCGRQTSTKGRRAR